MTSYIIAGKSDSQLLAECEALAELVETETRNVKIKTIMKYPDDWPEFSKKVCNTYGFKTDACPFVFTTDGQFIGDAQAFMAHISSKFGIKISLTREQIIKRTEHNTAVVAERHERMLKGPTFIEKVQEFIKKAKRVGTVRDLGGIYQTVNVQNLQFFVKVAPELTPLPDGKASLVPPLAVDTQTLETFKEKYEAHMELLAEKRKAEEERKKKEQELLEAQRLKEEEQKKESQRDNSKRSINASKGQSFREKEEDKNAADTTQQKPEEEGKTEAAVEPVPAQEVNKEEEKKEEPKVEEPPLVLPSPVKVPISSESVIEKVSSHNHHLVLKTSNTILSGELMVLPLSVDEENKGLVYYDYAYTSPRVPPQRSLIGSSEDPILEADQVPTHIGSYFVDIYNPLQHQDWDAWLNTITKLEGVGYMVIPPMDVKWENKVDACVMHVLPLPNDGISVLDSVALPIDRIIMAAAQYEKSLSETKSEPTVFTIAEYEFPHACHVIPAKAGPSVLAQIYEKCAEKVESDRHANPKHGMYVLLTEQWLLLAKLTKPYHNFEGAHSFLHGLSYAGVLTLPKIPEKWPQTAGIAPLEQDPLKILQASSI